MARRRNEWWLRRVIKPLVLLAVLTPAAWYTAGLLLDRLGANPIEAVTRGTGDWALRLLLVTLAMTPLRRATGWTGWLRLRRMLGLGAFFYGTVHLLLYLWLDQFFDWPEIWADILKRPFITVGMLTWGLLLPLALTSTRGWMRRLGRGWARLHRLVYLAAPLAVLHFWWMREAKVAVIEPLLYAVLLAGLLALRVHYWRLARARRVPAGGGRQPA